MALAQQQQEKREKAERKKAAAAASKKHEKPPLQAVEDTIAEEEAGRVSAVDLLFSLLWDTTTVASGGTPELGTSKVLPLCACAGFPISGWATAAPRLLIPCSHRAPPSLWMAFSTCFWLLMHGALSLTHHVPASLMSVFVVVLFFSVTDWLTAEEVECRQLHSLRGGAA